MLSNNKLILMKFLLFPPYSVVIKQDHNKNIMVLLLGFFE